MPTAQFIHDGDAIDYTPPSGGGDVAAGDVIVQEELVAVAKLDIPADTLGALHVTGVFDVPKATGVGTAIPAGSIVYWDEVAKEAYVPSPPGSFGTDKQMGKTTLAASDDDALVRVRLAQ